MIHKSLIFIAFVIATSPNLTKGANILYISSVPSPSHHIWNRALAYGLADKGYNVTYITPDEDKPSRPRRENYNVILLEGIYEDIHDEMNINDMADLSVLSLMKFTADFFQLMCDKKLRTEGFQQLWNYPKDFKFDLIVVDVTLTSCLRYLIQRFGYPPSVGVTPFLLPPYASVDFGNHLFPSYIPWYGFPYSNQMSFPQRVWNYLFTFLDVYLKTNVDSAAKERIAREILTDNLDSIKKIERHISLLLANTDPVLDFPQPLPPNIIPVGGLHARKSGKLPKNLQDLLDNSKNGVIVFSLGTNVRSDKLNGDIQKALLEAFAQIPHTVIWKYESDIQNLPKNVIVRKWLPQNDVLGHPNVKLFIGHGGALSTQEALYHGIPILAVPFFVDQLTNAQLIVSKKVGIEVNFRTITTVSFLKNLKEVLNNPIYQENAKLVSKRFRDQPQTPLERAIYWIEYALRHQGTDFLNTPARDMSFFASSSYDVVAFWTVTILFVIFVVYKLLVLITVRLICRKTFKEKLH